MATLTPDPQLTTPLTVRATTAAGAEVSQAVPNLTPIAGVAAADAAALAQCWFFPNYAEKVTALTPAAYYRFSDLPEATTVADSSGNARHLTLSAGVKGKTAGATFDRGGGGLFTGASKAQIGTYAPLAAGSTERTILGWAEVDSLASLTTLFGTVTTGGAGTAAEHGRLWIDTNGSIKWRQQSGTSGATSEVASAASLVTAGRWFHWALRHTDSTDTATLFINGVSVATSAVLTLAIHANAGGFALGGYGPVADFSGSIDEVSIHAASVSDADILDLAGRTAAQPVFTVS